MERVLEALGYSLKAELSVLLTDDPGIKELNERYLNRPKPTNVLSFAMAEGDFAQISPHLLGDIVVSLDTARREAEENGLDPDEHVVRLIIHGLLHLKGMHHEEDEDMARQVEELTEKLLETSLLPASIA